ncbi:MAG: lysophospholipid acyltransferase family protein [Pseudomonadota bacterium]
MQRFGETLFSAYFLSSLVVLGLLLAPVMLFGRARAQAVAQFWSRSVLFMLRLLTGVRHEVIGEQNIPQSGALVAANHQSAWETLALYAILPKPVAILKKELLRIPIFGWWVKAVGSIAVDREGGAKALRAMQRDALSNIQEGRQVIVFPEGTRTPPGYRQPFQPGVAAIYKAIDAPCTPVAHDSGRFWQHPGGRKNKGKITMRILAPIKPGLDRKSFLRLLENTINGARPDLCTSGNKQPGADLTPDILAYDDRP